MSYRDEMEDGTVFLEPAYLDAAIIGKALVGGYEVLAYSFQKLAKVMAAQDGMEFDDAVEWIEYNTMRSLPYMGEQRPIIVYEGGE